jgi:hypothetical protein
MIYSETPKDRKAVSVSVLGLSNQYTGISNGGSVPFDTFLDTTGNYSFSLNTSTGELTLDQTKQYYIRATYSLVGYHLDTNSGATDFRLYWADGNGNEILTSAGGFPIVSKWHGSSNTSGLSENIDNAIYISSSPVSSIKLVFESLKSTGDSTLYDHTRLLVMEIEQ